MKVTEALIVLGNGGKITSEYCKNYNFKFIQFVNDTPCVNGNSGRNYGISLDSLLTAKNLREYVDEVLPKFSYNNKNLMKHPMESLNEKNTK